MAAEPARKVPLGVGHIVSAAFGIFFRQFWRVLLLSVVGSILLLLLTRGIVWLQVADILGRTISFASNGTIQGIVVMVATFTVLGTVGGILARIAHDAYRKRPVTALRYIGSTRYTVLPIFSYLFVVIIPFLIPPMELPEYAEIAVVFAIVAWVIFVACALFVAIPVAMVERTGRNSLKRSISLTKGYRLGIFGLLIIAFFVMTLISIVSGFVVAAAFSSAAFRGTTSVFFYLLIGGVAYLGMVFGFAYIAIVSGLVYTRLLQIKEGLGSDEIASVFD
ncbi:MAG: hypothetical protein AAF393_04710 [Pseudomonadota bacterium]